MHLHQLIYVHTASCTALYETSVGVTSSDTPVLGLLGIGSGIHGALEVNLCVGERDGTVDPVLVIAPLTVADGNRG